IAFLTALEHLAYVGLRMDNMTYCLFVKIYSRPLKRYEVKFWLLEVPCTDESKSPEPVVSAPTSQ
ncbi:MAG: hypothetical protein AAB975_00665, partial [Patescibacteria group bacterium]